MDGDSGNVTLIDGGSGSIEIRPTDDIARPDLFSPPLFGIRSKHSRAEDCPLAARGFDDLFDLQAEISRRVGLLKKWMRGFQRSGEEDDAPNLSQNFFQSRNDGNRRSDPNEKDCLDTIQAGIESIGARKIAADEFNLRRDFGGFGIAGQHADRNAAFAQLQDNLTADGASSADEKDGAHGLIVHACHLAAVAFEASSSSGRPGLSAFLQTFRSSRK